MKTLALLVAAGVARIWAAPSVFPVGTTVYHPDKAWNGYTVPSSLGVRAALVIDMNGKVVKQEDGYNNNAGGSVRVLPGGIVIGPEGALSGRQDSLSTVRNPLLKERGLPTLSIAPKGSPMTGFRNWRTPRRKL